MPQSMCGLPHPFPVSSLHFLGIHFRHRRCFFLSFARRGFVFFLSVSPKSNYFLDSFRHRLTVVRWVSDAGASIFFESHNVTSFSQV